MQKYISWKLIVISIVAALISGIIIGGLIVLKLDMPEIHQLDYMNPPSITGIYSRDDHLIDEWYIEKREQLAFSEIPTILIQAVLTTEDRSFYSHNGVCIRGILRAIIKDILAGEYVEGASTITQQLAKTLFLTNEKKITRKIKEAILAFQLERRYTKDEILTRYLNQVYFGSGAYGVKSAAGLYFGKKLSELNISECALIAGLPKAPSWYSPLVNIKQSKKRRNTVLRQMAETGIITKDVCQKECNKPIVLKEESVQNKKPVFFLDEVRITLEEQFGSEYIYQKGLTVQTTIDRELQLFSEYLIEKHLIAIEQRNPHLDSNSLQASLIVIHNKTGDILCMVGGRKQKENYFNRATQAKRQPGSVIKPLIYAFAIENNYTQASLILDAPVIFGDWQPENYSRKYSGEITLRQALVRSLNIPCIRLLDQLGIDPVFHFCKNMGIEAGQYNLTFALGSSEVNLLNITSAYMVFPNQGIYIQPGFVHQVKDSNGRIVWVNRPQKRWVMSKYSAAIMTDMLKAVILEGTGKRAQSLKFPVAGKTGTTNDNRDAWFIGFSEEVTAGVWVGIDNNESIGENETGGKAALPIWIDVMKAVHHKYEKKSFSIPEDMIFVKIDVNTGKRSDNSNAVSMLFKKDSVPD